MSIPSKLHIIFILLLLCQIAEQKSIKSCIKKLFCKSKPTRDITIDYPFQGRDDVTLNRSNDRIKIDIPKNYCIENVDFSPKNGTENECIDLTDDYVDVIRIACKDKSEWTKTEPKNEKLPYICRDDHSLEPNRPDCCCQQGPAKPKPSESCLTFGQKICRSIIPCYQKINPCYEPKCQMQKKTCEKPHPLCECKQECPHRDTFVESVDPYDECVCEVSGLIDIAAASVVKGFHCVKNHYCNIKGCRPYITWKTIETKPTEKKEGKSALSRRTLKKIKPSKWISWKMIQRKKKNEGYTKKILNYVNPCKKKKKSMFSCLSTCLSCRFLCPGLAKRRWSTFFPWNWAS